MATLAVALVVVVVDQVTTSWVELDLHQPRHVVGPFGLGISYNTGSAFSFFTGQAAVLTLVALALVGLLLVLAWRVHSLSAALAVGLVLGGALGNLGDRLFRGHHGAVVDFITLRFWPTFNVADACIVIGVVWFALDWVLSSARA